MPEFSRKSLKRYLLVFAITCIGGVVLVWGYFFISMNIWIHEVDPELEHYSHRLISEKSVVRNPTPQDEDIALIDRVLINEMTRDRIVVNLSRSEVRFSPFRRRS